MILRPAQIHLMRLGLPVIPANMGGGGGTTQSQQTTDTSSYLTNNVRTTDSRSVASNGAIALGGAGDTVLSTTSTANTTNNSLANSNNTSNGNTSVVSNSGNTSTVTNKLNNSGNTTNTTYTTVTSTDYGAVNSALANMQTTASQAIGVSGKVASDALGDLNLQSANTIGLLSGLFTNASTSSANSQGNAMQALGMANNTTAQATSAISASQSAETKTTQMAMLFGVIVVAALIFKKG